MKYFTRESNAQWFSNRFLLLMATAVFSFAFASNVIALEELPPGFEIFPDGAIVVSDPTKAIAPPGYRIDFGGVLVDDSKRKLSRDSIEVMAGSDTVTDNKLAEVSTETVDEAMVSDTAEKQASKSSEIQEIPPGYHRMPNGDIMANSPSTAVAPEGYRLTEGGILRKLGDDSATPATQLSEADTSAVSDTAAAEPQSEAAKAGAAMEEIPPGFHRMPDGSVMANNPTTAVAPPGYHIMPDGTLMPDSVVAKTAGQHAHGGMLMFEYKYERMYMDGLLDTTDKVTPEEIVDPGGMYGYSMSPTDMSMDMHMFMLMYHTRDYMIMGMAHYMKNDMGMLAADGTESTMTTEGVGDTIITYSHQLKRNLALIGGLSIPTGSIDEHGPMQHSAVLNTDTKYPYGMQLGSGTYDFIIGANYTGNYSGMDWGVDYQYKLRTGTNDNDYTLGDVMELKGWMKYKFNPELTGSARMLVRSVGEIDGVDPELDENMSPAADAKNYGGNRVDLGFGIRWENKHMTSVGFEFSAPVHQDLNGPQMSIEWITGLTFGYMF